MDSLQGIPVEYKLDAFNMPRTGPTLCHPKIGYVDLTRNPALDTLALNSPLGHLNGDNAYSPQIPDTKLTVTSKVQFLQLQHVFRQKCNEHNPSHVRRHTLPSQPSQHLITQFRLNTHPLSRVLQHQKQTQIFHTANRNLFTKTHFDSRHLTSSFSPLYTQQTTSEVLTTLSEETTQRKHTYVTTYPR